jgi:hypothetical protein
MDYLSSAKLLEYSRKLKDVMYSKEEIDELFTLSNEGFQSAITNLTEQFNDALIHVTVDEENETLVIENGAPLIDINEVLGISTVNTYLQEFETPPEDLLQYKYNGITNVANIQENIVPITSYEIITEEPETTEGGS